MAGRRQDGWLRTTVPFARRLLRDHVAGRASLVAGSIAFFAVLSVAPLLVLGVVMAGALVGTGTAHDEIVRELGESIGTLEAARIDQLVQDARTSGDRWWMTLFSLLVMAFGATRLFLALQQGLNQIWGVSRRAVPGRTFRERVLGVVRKRALAFLMVIGAGLLMLVVVMVRLLMVDVVAWLEESPVALVWRLVEPLGSLAVVTFIFAAIYRFLPDVRLGWRDLTIGAVVTAVLYSIGLVALRFYLRVVAGGSSTGAAGSFAALLVWLYYCAHIFLLGAQFTWRWAHEHGVGSSQKPDAAASREG